MSKLSLSDAAPNEAAIFNRVILPGIGKLPAALARRILSMRFSGEDVDRINELSAKAREGTLSLEENNELDSYLRIGHFLSVMKSKARRALKQSGYTA